MEIILFFFLGVNNKEKLSFFNTIYFLNEKRKVNFTPQFLKRKNFFQFYFF